ncbi:shikimate dehydrogenase [Novosphingobium lentum]|uniref:shikimate dehydrogenase n=1 Tax=Novosphingobium lentum TaxID=145287 RepID=UPI00082C77C4|nr:shikimate dehydrogenase [Novosphingobium lentum]
MIRSGLFGRAITASRSPWLHEQEAKAQGLDLHYELFDFTERGLPDDALGPLLRQALADGFSGVNVTFPFKQAVLPLLDEVADSAALVGAVNTIAMRDGRLVGHNTDMSGFKESMEQGLPGAALHHVLQLGAGGAGAAVASALLLLGTDLLEISDVDPSRAQALAATLQARFGTDRVRASNGSGLDTATVDGIVNATPMGMASKPGMSIDPALVRPHHWVADIVYFPIETELLRQAQVKGCAILDGSGMVIAQAARAFEIITGHPADKQRMRASFFAA